MDANQSGASGIVRSRSGLGSTRIEVIAPPLHAPVPEFPVV
jgi:hypothetical protein